MATPRPRLRLPPSSVCDKTNPRIVRTEVIGSVRGVDADLSAAEWTVMAAGDRQVKDFSVVAGLFVPLELERRRVTDGLKDFLGRHMPIGPRSRGNEAHVGR